MRGVQHGHDGLLKAPGQLATQNLLQLLGQGGRERERELERGRREGGERERERERTDYVEQWYDSDDNKQQKQTETETETERQRERDKERETKRDRDDTVNDVKTIRGKKERQSPEMDERDTHRRVGVLLDEG